jgi:hypothetical protein
VRDDAEAKRAELRLRRRRGERIEPVRKSFEEYAWEWLERPPVRERERAARRPSSPAATPTSRTCRALIERLSGGGYERSLVYSGLRGVGKTVLLMEFDVLASEAGWATTDVQEVGSQPDFRLTFARMATRLLREMSRKHRVKDSRGGSWMAGFSSAPPASTSTTRTPASTSRRATTAPPDPEPTTTTSALDGSAITPRAPRRWQRCR